MLKNCRIIKNGKNLSKIIYGKSGKKMAKQQKNGINNYFTKEKQNYFEGNLLNFYLAPVFIRTSK